MVARLVEFCKADLVAARRALPIVDVSEVVAAKKEGTKARLERVERLKKEGCSGKNGLHN